MLGFWNMSICLKRDPTGPSGAPPYYTTSNLSEHAANNSIEEEGGFYLWFLGHLDEDKKMAFCSDCATKVQLKVWIEAWKGRIPSGGADVVREVIGLWPSSLKRVSTQARVLKSHSFMAPCESPDRHAIPFRHTTNALILASPLSSIVTPPDLWTRRSST